MINHQLPLEDTFGDILRKALKGTGTSEVQLADAAGIAKDTIARWLKDEGAADDEQARAVAAILRLDGEKLAASAAGRWQPPPIERADIRRHPQDPQPSNGYVFFLAGRTPRRARRPGRHPSQPAARSARR